MATADSTVDYKDIPNFPGYRVGKEVPRDPSEWPEDLRVREMPEKASAVNA